MTAAELIEQSRTYRVGTRPPHMDAAATHKALVLLLKTVTRSALLWAADLLGTAAAILWELSGAELPGVARAENRQ